MDIKNTMEKELVNYIWNALKIIYGCFTSGEKQKCKLQIFLYSFLYMLKFHSRRQKVEEKKKRKKLERNGIKNWFHFGESTGVEKIPHEKSASKPRVA